MSTLDRLRETLEAQEALFLELRDCLQSERRAMDELDAPALEALVRTKEAIAAEVRLVDPSRAAVAAELARECGLASAEPSLAELIEVLGPEGEPLRSLRERLRSLVAAVGELTEANVAYADRSLGEVRATLELFARLAPSEPTYAPSRGAEPGRDVGRLVHRSA